MPWPPRAGQIARASDLALVPGQRIATAIETLNDVGGPITSTDEVQVMSVQAPVQAGRVYGLWFWSLGRSSGGTATVLARIRAGSITGSVVSLGRDDLPSGNQGAVVGPLYGEFTATETATVTFVATYARSAGTGTITFNGGSSPGYLAVEYIRG